MCLQDAPVYPWNEQSWQSTLGLFPKMQVLWLNTCQALSDELAWALRDDSDEEIDDEESEADDAESAETDDAESKTDESQTETDEEIRESPSEIDNSQAEGSTHSQFNSQSNIITIGTVSSGGLGTINMNSNSRQLPAVEKGISDHRLGVYLEPVVEQWASSNPSLCRIYVLFGYDIGLNIIDGLRGVIGHRYRMMKQPSGEWASISFTYRTVTARTGANPGLHDDGLPGILDEDMDFWG